MIKPKSDLYSSTIIYFILLCAFVFLRTISNAGLFNFMGSYASYVFSILAQIGVLLVSTFFLYKLFTRKKNNQILKDFRFNKVSWRSVLMCFAIGVIVFFLTVAISSFFNTIIRLFGYAPRTSGTTVSEYPFWQFIVSIIFTAVLPGICEEVANRGLLLSGFKQLGMKKAIIFSALLFGLMHLNIEQFFYASIIGGLLGFICIATNSIYSGMIIHFMNNAFSVYTDFARVNKLPLGNIFSNLTNSLSTGSFIAVLIGVFAVLIILAFLLVWLVYLVINDTNKYNKIKKDEKTEKIPATGIENAALTAKANLFSEIDFKNSLKFYNVNIAQNAKMAFREKLFLYSTFILGSFVTVLTFVWGII